MLFPDIIFSVNCRHDGEFVCVCAHISLHNLLKVFIYLLLVYSMTLSVAQTMYHKMVGLSMQIGKDVKLTAHGLTRN
jgi:hypothetical protein